MLSKNADNLAVNRSTEKRFKLVGDQQLISICSTGKINSYAKVSVYYTIIIAIQNIRIDKHIQMLANIRIYCLFEHLSQH